MGGGVGQGVVGAKGYAGDVDAIGVDGVPLEERSLDDPEVIGLEDGTCVVPSRLSTDIVRQLEPGAVTFAHHDDHVTISAARSNFKLRTFPVVEFPAVAYIVSPARAAQTVERVSDWGHSHSRKIAIVLATAVGVWLIVKGIIEL